MVCLSAEAVIVGPQLVAFHAKLSAMCASLSFLHVIIPCDTSKQVLSLETRMVVLCLLVAILCQDI